MPELAYLNGSFGPIASAVVSIEDRGFQFGDAVYEVIAVYNGRPFLLEQHLTRLRRSLAGIGIEFDVKHAGLEASIHEGIRRSGFTDTMVYIQISRGAAPRSHAIPEGLTPTVVMTFKALPGVPDDLRERGASVMTTREIRWAHCYIKAVTLLPNILAKNESLRRGYDDAIFVTDGGEVRECTSSNIFIARRGELLMPPRTEAVLHGITQGYLLACAEGIGLPIREQAFNADALRAADEAFMSGSISEVLGITRIDDRPVGDGTVGPITRRLYAEFMRRARPAAVGVG